MNAFLAALTLFTRIPIPSSRMKSLCDEDFDKGIDQLPLVGLMLGAVAATIYLLLIQLLPEIIAVILCLGLLTATSGALHEDGFADVVDGFFSGKPSDQILDIMKDPRLGTFAVAALIFKTLILVSALNELAKISSTLAVTALILMASLSRLSPFLPMSQLSRLSYESEPAQSNTSNLIKMSKMSHHTETHKTKQFWLKPSSLTTLFLVLVISLLLIGPMAITYVTSALIAALLAGVISTRLIRKKLGAYNGDCLGFAQQLSECLILLAILCIAA